MIRNLLAALALAAICATAPPADAMTMKDRTPPCKYEDGSGQARCVWDARHMGNGAGNSLVIINGGDDDAIYRQITHKRAHWLMTTAN